DLRARYMSVDTGRFVSRDTVMGSPGSPLSQNRYIYGDADPVDLVDPSGHESLGEVSVALGIAASLAALPTISGAIGSLIWRGLPDGLGFGVGFVIHEGPNHPFRSNTMQWNTGVFVGAEAVFAPRLGKWGIEVFAGAEGAIEGFEAGTP